MGILPLYVTTFLARPLLLFVLALPIYGKMSSFIKEFCLIHMLSRIAFHTHLGHRNSSFSSWQ